ELLTRSFSYSALRTYMHIPTKKLLTRILWKTVRKKTKIGDTYWGMSSDSEFKLSFKKIFKSVQMYEKKMFL
uniref:hypothetical protein n=1 Tax=Bacteroides fragilis TaxID=817 RepID=UPI00321A4A6D